MVVQNNLSKGFAILNKNKSSNMGISQVIENKDTRSRLSQDDLYEPYSAFYMSKRNISSDELRLYFEGKSIFLLPTLLKTVIAPMYNPPTLDNDWVVLGIVAYKSVPKHIQNEKMDLDIKSKYCVFILTDLKWEIRLFLFGKAFERYWKIQVGYIVAILNPGIMKPKKIDSGDFGLVLSYQYDSILELGLSRDLGFCNVLKRDGKQCSAWVDIRYSEVCEFHVDKGINKTRNSRMEMAVGTCLYSSKKNRYKSTKVSYSKGLKSAEGILSEYSGWVYDPCNGNVFIMSGFSNEYQRDAMGFKRNGRMRQQHQKKVQESNTICRFLTYEHSVQKVNNSLKNNTEPTYLDSHFLGDSPKLYERPFSTQSIKRIGFDPYSHSVFSSHSVVHPLVSSLSSGARYSSDSDLEII